MDANEVNKVAGAILGMATLAMGIGFFSGALVSPKSVLKAGYELPDDSGAAAGHSAPAAEKVEPIAVRLASADAKKGESSAKKCVSCHNFGKEGKNGTGPGLWGLVNRDSGKHEGFKYSAAMAAKGIKWDYEALDHFLTKPKEFVAGTSMGFAGVPRADERANIIAFLRTLSDNPVPLPK
jgi:cytochrome c